MEEKQENQDDKRDEEEKGETEIEAQFASLELSVRTEGKEDCKEIFDETWEKLMNDAETMSEAARERLGGSDY